MSEIDDILNEDTLDDEPKLALLKKVVEAFSPMALPSILRVIGRGAMRTPEEEEILHEAFDKVIAADECHQHGCWSWE